MSKWMPIETAPKDGTPIIVYPAWYRDGAYVSGQAHWKEGKRASGWNCYWTWIPMPPTHWMPLPDPPTD